MTKAPGSLRELRRRIYRKAKSEKTHRFWGLFVHVTKLETLEEAYRIAKRNGGAPGIDGQSFSAIESEDLSIIVFSGKCGTTSSQAGINPCRTAGWKYPKGMGKSERSRFRR